MDNKFRLHTPVELKQIAEDDFKRFKEIAKEYYHKYRECYISVTYLNAKTHQVNLLRKDKETLTHQRGLTYLHTAFGEA